MIKDIAFSAYPVTDIAEARRFYEDILGLVPSQSLGESWQEYDVGQGTFVIVQKSADTPEFYSRPGSAVAFEVEDLDAAVVRVQERGVPVVFGPADFPACRMFVIADPDGNVVTLHQAGKG